MSAAAPRVPEPARTARLWVAGGDPGGAGLRALLRVLAREGTTGLALVAPPALVRRIAQEEGLAQIPEVVQPEGCADAEQFAARPDECNGRWALRCLEVAVGRCQAGDALLTLPVHKHAVARVAPGFHGQTEWLRAKWPERTLYMAYRMGADDPGVVLATEHVGVEAALQRLRRLDWDSWWAGLRAAWERVMGPALPAACAGINPHAGEQGLLGSEEVFGLTPFCARRRASGEDVRGPWAADTALRRACSEGIRLLAYPFHDTGLAAAKALWPGLVHITLGLPFLRVSPSHGVAYDAAGGRGLDTASVAAALALARAQSGT